MSDAEDNLPAASVGDEVPNPGLPPHRPRPTDVDVHAARRAERQVATFFMLSIVCVLLFMVAYFTLGVGDDPDLFLGFGASHLALGVTLGLALLFIGIGLIQWARKLMSDVEIVEMRHPVASSEADRQEALTDLGLGLEDSGIARRPLIRNTLIGALGLVGLTPIIALRDLGPTPQQVTDLDQPGAGLASTVWVAGMRVVRDVIGTPIKLADLEVGDLVNAQPEVIFNGGEDGGPMEGVALQIAKSKASVIVLRMPPDDIVPGQGREDWAVQGVVCYSKICTHVGCPISLNERTTHNVLCPCHQSTFDLADSGKVVFGPAGRPLPQLPLTVDDEGYLCAQSDFTEPVGPSYWERDSQ